MTHGKTYEYLHNLTMDELIDLEREIQKVKKENEEARFKTLTEKLISIFNQIGREFPKAEINLPDGPAVYWHNIAESRLDPSCIKKN